MAAPRGGGMDAQPAASGGRAASDAVWMGELCGGPDHQVPVPQSSAPFPFLPNAT